MCQIEIKNHNTCSGIFIRDNVKKYVNNFFSESGTMILLHIKQYRIDDSKKKSMLKNVFKDTIIKNSLECNLKELLNEYEFKDEYCKILWYAFSSNTNPDFKILLQRFMISVPEHAKEIKEKIDEEKWGLLETPAERKIHDENRLGIYARYRSGEIPRDIDRVQLINANENIGFNLTDNWLREVLYEEKKGTFYQWMDNEIECKKALFSANLPILKENDREYFYEYMKFIWNNIDKGIDAMLLYTAKPIAYAPGGIPENSIGEVYLAEYHQPLSKPARDIIIEYLESIALILHAQFARDDTDQLNKSKKEDHILYAARAATARIINRNYAHHIGSHVSLRSTFNEIYLRVTGEQFKDMKLSTTSNGNDLVRSIVEMENKLTRYKDERNDFIAGIEDNIHPVTAKFYQDIILPFIENSLLMDNLAKSENVYWETENNKVKCDGKSKLRIRVFYRKNHESELTECKSKEIKIPSDFSDCLCSERTIDETNDVLTLQDLGIDDKWIEILAFYDEINLYECIHTQTRNKICTHKLPYLKYIKKAGDEIFYGNRKVTFNDIEISMPGSLGAHSIYSLLENLIRNTAKHADKKVLAKAQNLDIVIKIKEPDEEIIKYDFFDIEFTTNIPSIKSEEQLNKIIEKLKEKLNDESQSLGFADMRINATLLRFDEITQKNLDNSITLEKYSHSNNSDSYSLSVNLKLSKPHKIILIGEQFNTYDSIDNKTQGIWYFKNINDCITNLKERKRAFQFAIVAPEIFAELSMEEDTHGCTHADELLQYLPWRILVTIEKKECKINTCLHLLVGQRRVTCISGLNLDMYITKSKLNAEKVLAACWDKWMQNRWGGNFKLNFYFEKDEKLKDRFTIPPKDSEYLSDIYIPTILESQLTNKEDKRYIFYDRHGRNGICLYEESDSNETYLFNNDDFFKEHAWIHIDKNNPDFDIINSWKPGSTENNLSFMAQLAESGLHRILVVDERASQIANKNALHSNQWGSILKLDDRKYFWEAAAGQVFIANSMKIGNEEILDNSNITVPNISIVFNGSEATIISDIIGDIPFDTLIIHRTMFDKLFKNENFKSHWKTLNSMFPNILIDTGGGTLEYDDPNVMKRIKKISFTNVHKLLLNGNLAKNCLTKYL